MLFHWEREDYHKRRPALELDNVWRSKYANLSINDRGNPLISSFLIPRAVYIHRHVTVRSPTILSSF